MLMVKTDFNSGSGRVDISIRIFSLQWTRAAATFYMAEWKTISISFSPPLARAHSFIERSSFIRHAFLTILWPFTVVSALLVRFITYTCFLIKSPGHSSSVLWVFAIAIAAVFSWWGTGSAEVSYQHKHIRHILSRSCDCRFSRFQLYSVLSAVLPQGGGK